MTASSIAAPTEPDIIIGAADTPDNRISSFHDLSQEDDQGEIKKSVEEVEEEVEQVPAGGGTTTSNDVAVPLEERAGRPEQTWRIRKKCWIL